MILYHVTKEKWIESIRTFGLIPSYRKGLTCSKKWEFVFLTDDPKRIIKTQCGEEYSKKHKLAILRIDCSDLEIEPLKYRNGATYTLSDFEFTHLGRIDPIHILTPTSIHQIPV